MSYPKGSVTVCCKYSGTGQEPSQSSVLLHMARADIVCAWWNYFVFHGRSLSVTSSWALQKWRSLLPSPASVLHSINELFLLFLQLLLHLWMYCAYMSVCIFGALNLLVHDCACTYMYLIETDILVKTCMYQRQLPADTGSCFSTHSPAPFMTIGHSLPFQSTRSTPNVCQLKGQTASNHGAQDQVMYARAACSFRRHAAKL